MGPDPLYDGFMDRFRRLLAAVVLGVGAIFGLKGDASEHWSEPPNVVVSADQALDDAASGDPDVPHRRH